MLIIDHFQVKSWTETSFDLDPITLLRLQYFLGQKDHELEYSPNFSPTTIALHCRRENDTRAISYMTIDVNRRLFIWYGFINVLNTITQLNDQLPVCVLNEVKTKISMKKMKFVSLDFFLFRKC